MARRAAISSSVSGGGGVMVDSREEDRLRARFSIFCCWTGGGGTETGIRSDLGLVVPENASHCQQGSRRVRTN